MPATELDFAAFRAAFEGKDRERWLSFYADDAEWIEYRHFSPPRAPNRMVGSAAIGSHLAEVCASDLALVLGDEVLSAERVAFSVECRFRDGRRVLEHVIAEVRDGRIVRQVDVEAWD